MKQILFVFAALIVCGNSFSQIAPNYRFRKPVVVTANTSWKFKSVASGVDALVTITGSRNATVDKIDDSTIYAYAWNPAIKYTSTTTSASDSSYVEFKIDFLRSSNNNPINQSNLAMTIIDCDGTLSFREMVKVSQPATSTGIIGSLLSIVTGSNWLTSLGSIVDLSGIDTSVYIAMNQINYSNITSYKMKVGVLGRITGGTVRQASFYYKGFSAMTVPLAVELTKFNAEANNTNAELSWSTASEINLDKFEIYRSLDGTNFSFIGSVKANGNSNDLINYSFKDFAVNGPVAFYKLRMVDTDGEYKWSSIAKVKFLALTNTGTISVFPNPTTEIVNLTLSETPLNDIQVSIVDAFGKNIQTVSNPEMTSNNMISFDVRNFENGIYFINIQSADGSSTSSKFIKR